MSFRISGGRVGFTGGITATPVTATTPTPTVALDTVTIGVSMILSNNDLTVAGGTTTWENARSAIGRTTGKWVFEITSNFTPDVSNEASVGVVQGATATGIQLGADATSRGLQADATGTTDPGEQTHPVTWNTSGDTVMVLVDLDNRRLGYKNSTNENANWFPLEAGVEYFGAVSLRGTSANVTVNFGSSFFVNGIPAGFKSWDDNQTAGPINFTRPVIWDRATVPTPAGPQVTVDNAGLNAVQTGSTNWYGLWASDAKTGFGRYAFEVTANLSNASGRNASAGVALDTADVDNAYLGQTTGSVGMFQDGSYIYPSNILVASTEDWTAASDTVMVILDLNVEGIFFDTGVNAEPSFFSQASLGRINEWYAAATLDQNQDITVNFGATPFVHSLPVSTESWDGNQENTVVELDPNADFANLTFTNNNLTVTQDNATREPAFSTKWRNTGKYAFEVTANTNYVPGTTSASVGISRDYPSSVPWYPGQDAISWGSFQNGDTRNNNTGSTISNIAFDTAGDVVMFLADIDQGDLYAVSTTTGILTTLYTGASFAGTYINPVVSLLNSPTSVTVNFGAATFVNTLPAGYTSWDGSQSA